MTVFVPTLEMDLHDALVDSCEQWGDYPCNTLRPTQLMSTLDAYRRELENSERRLFNPALETVNFFELQDGDHGKT